MTRGGTAYGPQSVPPAPSPSPQMAPTVAALCAHAAEICDAEVAHALARLGDLSPRDAFVVRAMAQRIVGRLLHRPTTVLTAHAGEANMAAVVRRLFHLELEPEQLVTTKPTR